MKALNNHFAGEVNATTNIYEAEQLRDFLHYKNERSMAFELFLTKSHKMYNLFEEEGEPMEEDAKICFIFKQVEHSDLYKSIQELKYQM